MDVMKNGIITKEKDELIFKIPKNYKFNKIFFQGALWITIFTFFIYAYAYDYDLNYYECNDVQCKNPFFHGQSWQNEEYLPNGIYGTKLNVAFGVAIPIALFIFAFILNHFYQKIGGVKK